MPGSREVVLIDAPDLVDDYLTVRLTALGHVVRTSSRAVDDAVRMGDVLDRTSVSDVVLWLPDAVGVGDAAAQAVDDVVARRALEALLPAVVVADGSVVVLADQGAAEARTGWFRDLGADWPTTQVHVLRHGPVAGAFWDCRGELQTLATSGHVGLPVLADAVAGVLANRTPGYHESSLSTS